MRITYNPGKREKTLAERGLDFRRAMEVFDGPHLTREDDRMDYGEPRFVTMGWLDARLVILVWTPRGRAPCDIDEECKCAGSRKVRLASGVTLMTHLKSLRNGSIARTCIAVRSSSGAVVRPLRCARYQ